MKYIIYVETVEAILGDIFSSVYKLKFIYL